MASSGPSPGAPSSAPIETLPTVYTEPAHAQSEDTVDRDFLRGVPGILKLIEMIFSLVTFICASCTSYHKDAAGWIQFVSMTAFVLTSMLYIFYVFKLPPKLARTFPFKFSELCYYVVFTVFYFISGVVAACYAPHNAALSAAAFFAFASWVVFGIDIYFRLMDWRHSNEGPYFSRSSSANVPPSSTSADRVQY